MNRSSNTKTFPDGGTALSFYPGGPILRMNSKYTITCPQQDASFKGTVRFTYGDSISTGIDVTSTSAVTLIADAIKTLSDLLRHKWTSVDVGVSITGGSTTAICSSSGIKLQQYQYILTMEIFRELD